MVNWNLFRSTQAVRVIAGNVDRASNTLEIAANGEPLYDELKSLGLFSMPRDQKWAHVYGTSMLPEGIKDGAFIGYQAVSTASGFTPTTDSVLLLRIDGERERANLHGGYKLRKFISFDTANPALFNEVSYDADGKPHAGLAKLDLIVGEVMFH